MLNQFTIDGDELPFLEAIQANPVDPTVYLIYADWLEERNDLRAEYLRAQLEYFRFLETADSKKRGWKVQQKRLYSRAFNAERAIAKSHADWLKRLTELQLPVGFDVGEPLVTRMLRLARMRRSILWP